MLFKFRKPILTDNLIIFFLNMPKLLQLRWFYQRLEWFLLSFRKQNSDELPYNSLRAIPREIMLIDLCSDYNL